MVKETKKRFKQKTITICPKCRDVTDMTKTRSTVVLLVLCLAHRRFNDTRRLKDIEEAGFYF
jgi:hypothetical protein